MPQFALVSEKSTILYAQSDMRFSRISMDSFGLRRFSTRFPHKTRAKPGFFPVPDATSHRVQIFFALICRYGGVLRPRNSTIMSPQAAYTPPTRNGPGSPGIALGVFFGVGFSVPLRGIFAVFDHFQ